MSKSANTQKSFTLRQLPKGLTKNTSSDVVEADGIIVSGRDEISNEVCIYILSGDHFEEEYRLATFGRYPSDVPIKLWDLAKSGFYYTGFKDRVICYFCGNKVENWMITDNPLSDVWHLTTCQMALHQPCGNIPLRNKSREYLRRIQEAVVLHNEVQLRSEIQNAGENNANLSGDVEDNVVAQGNDDDRDGESPSSLEQPLGDEAFGGETSAPQNDPAKKELESLLTRRSRLSSLGASSRNRPRSRDEESVPRKRHRSGSADVAGDSLDGAPIEDEQICPECKRNPPSGVRLPCGHLAPCVECSKEQPSTCTICDLAESEEHDE